MMDGAFFQWMGGEVSLRYQRQGQGLREGRGNEWTPKTSRANPREGDGGWWKGSTDESGDRKLGMAQSEKWSEQATRETSNNG